MLTGQERQREGATAGDTAGAGGTGLGAASCERTEDAALRSLPGQSSEALAGQLRGHKGRPQRRLFGALRASRARPCRASGVFPGETPPSRLPGATAASARTHQARAPLVLTGLLSGINSTEGSRGPAGRRWEAAAGERERGGVALVSARGKHPVDHTGPSPSEMPSARTHCLLDMRSCGSPEMTQDPHPLRYHLPGHNARWI
ncbi:uncharacterized protein LOC129048406 [Pongo abelii]|uniref:uncharacterized protein LOC129048406 n=1 Tax=Pongo abelii TaxID=9601 RepID=UPI00300787C1